MSTTTSMRSASSTTSDPVDSPKCLLRRRRANKKRRRGGTQRRQCLAWAIALVDESAEMLLRNAGKDRTLPEGWAISLLQNGIDTTSVVDAGNVEMVPVGRLALDSGGAIESDAVGKEPLRRSRAYVESQAAGPIVSSHTNEIA